jgi:hypothetical protein
LQPGTELSLNVPPSEEQEQNLRGHPEQVTTISGEAFNEMGHDLKSNFQDVLHGLKNAIGQGSAFADPKLQVARNQLHRRQTRSSAQELDQFFKSLIPKDKVPDHDGNIKVEFAGTNNITTNAPGYTETISFGDGVWSRTRNGVTDTGRLNEEAGARIAEQTKQMIDEIMRHTASRLTGMMGPSGWFGPPARSGSPKGAVPPPSAADPPRGSDGYHGFGSGPPGKLGEPDNVGSNGKGEVSGHVRASVDSGTSGKIRTTENDFDPPDVLSDADVPGRSASANDDASGGDFFGISSTSGLQNRSNKPVATDGAPLSTRKKTRPKAADMFEQNEDGEFLY